GSVGDDAGGAVRPGAQGQHVPEGAGSGVSARLDDHHLAPGEGVEGALLGVVAAAVTLEQVLAAGQEPQRGGKPYDLSRSRQGTHAVDGHIVQPPTAQLLRQGGHGSALEFFPQLPMKSWTVQPSSLFGAPGGD